MTRYNSSTFNYTTNVWRFVSVNKVKLSEATKLVGETSLWISEVILLDSRFREKDIKSAIY